MSRATVIAASISVIVMWRFSTDPQRTYDVYEYFPRGVFHAPR